MALVARFILGLVLMGTVATAPARAQSDELEVDLELVLAVDVSGSMGPAELALQRGGYVAAFRHPDVIGAIERGLIGRIAVMYFEWAGPDRHRVVVPWSLIATSEDAHAFADVLALITPRNQLGTSISGALARARGFLDDNDFRGLRQVIDISGDGPNNLGEPVVPERDVTVGEGITINGLPLQFDRGGLGFQTLQDLSVYYEDCVIGGPGAFVMPVNDIDLFDVAVRRKLVLEIAGLPARLIPAQFERDEPPTDCLIGEKLRQQRFFFR